MLEVRTAGAEVATTWMPLDVWRVEGTYARFSIDPMPKPGSTDPGAATYDGSTPEHHGSVRSRLSITRDVDFDVNLFAFGRLRQLAIPGYTRLDARLAWRARPGVELAVAGQNLLTPRHPEFGGLDTEANATEVPRSVELEVSWEF